MQCNISKNHGEHMWVMYAQGNKYRFWCPGVFKTTPDLKLDIKYNNATSEES